MPLSHHLLLCHPTSHPVPLFLPLSSLLQEAACRKEEEERRARERQEEEEAKCLEKFEGAEPLEAAELLAFTDSMLPGCSQLLDELPDTVYRVCDLIMTAVKRNGAAYRDSVLKQVVKQVKIKASPLLLRSPQCAGDTLTPQNLGLGSGRRPHQGSIAPYH